MDSSASDPGGILTHDLQNRNLTFYTAELRGHFRFAAQIYIFFAKKQSFVHLFN